METQHDLDSRIEQSACCQVVVMGRDLTKEEDHDLAPLIASGHITTHQPSTEWKDFLRYIESSRHARYSVSVFLRKPRGFVCLAYRECDMLLFCMTAHCLYLSCIVRRPALPRTSHLHVYFSSICLVIKSMMTTTMVAMQGAVCTKSA